MVIHFLHGSMSEEDIGGCFSVILPLTLHLNDPKTQKIDFLKKPQFHELAEHWRFFPQWPWSDGCHQTPVCNSKNNYLAVGQCVTISGGLLRIIMLETLDFTWDLISPIHMLYKNTGLIWELFKELVQPNLYIQ